MVDTIRYDRFTIEDGDVVIRVPQCERCKYFHGDISKAHCDAFRERFIPDAILLGNHDHREPYPGDNGIRFEPIDAEADTEQS